MTEMRGYAAAQREWEAMTPPDDGPYECVECSGKGVIYTDDPMGLGCDECETCTECDGLGHLSANGEPFDPHKKERDESDYADWRRDEERSREDRHE